MCKIEKILEEFKEEIQALYSSNLRKILLYGSWAREDAGSHSDIDIVVILKGDISRKRNRQNNRYYY